MPRNPSGTSTLFEFRQYRRVSEKELIERAWVEAFIRTHNQQFGSTYRVKEFGDAPDAVLIDNNGNELMVEVTMIEDRSGDTNTALGRSDRRKSRRPAGAGSPKQFSRDASAEILKSRLRRN